MLKLILLLLLSICVIICTKRSAIVAYVVFWIIYWLYSSRKQKKKILLFFVSMIFVAIFIIYSIPQLSSVQGLLESSIFFWNDDMKIKNDIHGSSFSMRVEQVLYPFVLVADNFLFGKGFGWHTYYLSEHELHPVLQGFESIITVAISDGGFCGLILWSYLFYISYKYSSLKDKKKKYYKIFTFVQLTIAIATGFSYFFFYGMYIVLLNRFYLLRDKGQ